MPVGIMKIEIYFEYSHSLKEKRSIMKKIINKLREKFNISVAEVGYQEKWQRSLFALACVGSDYGIVNKTLESASDFLEDNFDGEIVNVDKEFV